MAVSKVRGDEADGRKPPQARGKAPGKAGADPQGPVRSGPLAHVAPLRWPATSRLVTHEQGSKFQVQLQFGGSALTPRNEAETWVLISGSITRRARSPWLSSRPSSKTDCCRSRCPRESRIGRTGRRCLCRCSTRTGSGPSSDPWRCSFPCPYGASRTSPLRA